MSKLCAALAGRSGDIHDQVQDFCTDCRSVLFCADHLTGADCHPNCNCHQQRGHASTQKTDPQSERLAKLEQQIADAKSSADNAWMLTSSALVLMMTGPGLALFYGGLVRKKNVLATMMQSFAMMAMITVLWALVGYSLAFGREGQLYRRPSHYLFLRGVGAAARSRLRRHHSAADVHDLSAHVRHHHSGADHRRLCRAHEVQRHGACSWSLWSIIVYCPMAHMVWGKGGLLNAALGGRFPTLDFAGGTVVHITSGVSALVCALYLGQARRISQENPCRRTAWCSALSAPACCGSAGSDSMPAALWPPAAWPPAPLSPRTLPPPPPPSAGAAPNGCATASPAPWARSPALSPDWSPSLRPPDSSARCPRWPSA